MQEKKKMDTSFKYFLAISENKRKEMELKGTETKIDDLKKKMLTRYWKEKISVFDEMIRLNVKTPRYDDDKLTSGDQSGKNASVSLGPMAIDSKLLSNRPVTLQKGSRPGSRIEPVISIEGTDAVCYPNKEAKRGRKVGLNQSVLRRMELCKALEDNIASIRCKSAARRSKSPIRNDLDVERPKTAAPKLSGSQSKDPNPNPESSSKPNPERSTTSLGSFTREAYISTPLPRRPSTSSVLSRDKISPR